MTASANLDLVRSIYADWEGGDFSRIDWADPDIEFAWPEGLDAGPGGRGRRALAEGRRTTMAERDSLSVTAEEYRELDDELIMLQRFRARGKISGLQIEGGLTKGAVLFAVHQGRVTRLVTYLRRDHALADLGLEK